MKQRVDRRRFLTILSGGLAAGAALATAAVRGAEGAGRYQAVAFDAFPVFDPRPVARLAETIFPGKGAALSDAWRSRQFEYQWLRALAGRYADFRRTTEEALDFAARQHALELTPGARARLMGAWDDLQAWPDASAALRALRQQGLRLVFLSNMTAGMLEAGIRNARLEGLFEQVLSTDRLRTYKPDPRAYAMAPEALGLDRGRILFVSFAGWDSAGAKWFGYPTFWVNRLGLPVEALDTAPDAMGGDLRDLVAFVRGGP
jgi:2-haloacid dehalogenase